MLRKRLELMFLVTVLAVAACATGGKESFDLGRQLAQQNRLEEAVSMYEDAASKEPGNAVYVSALNEAKELLTKSYVDKVRSYLETKPLTSSQLKSALYEADKAVKLSPDNEAAKAVAGRAKAAMNDLTSKAEDLYSQASKSAEANEWAAAVTQLRQIQGFYPDYLDLSSKLGAFSHDGLAYYLEAAEKYEVSDDMENLIKVLASARDIAPDDQKISSRLNEAMRKHTAEYYVSRGETMAVQDDWGRVKEYIAKANALGPGSDVVERIGKLREKAVSFFLARAEQALEQSRLYGAYDNIVVAEGFSPDLMTSPRSSELVDRTASALTSKAAAYESGDKLGNALVWYEKALRLSPRSGDVFKKAQSLKDKIKQRVVKKIAIMDFTSPSHSADAGRIVTDSLLAYLTKNSSGDIKILARDVLGALVKEIEMGQAGIYDIETAKKAGKLKGTDVFIFGSVLQYDVEKTADEGYKVVNAVVGKKNVPNAAYQTWLASHAYPTEQDLKNAPPQFTEEEIRETVRYKVGNHKKVANVYVSFRVVDVVEGEVLVTKTLKNRKEAEDTYSEGVDFANIQYKQLRLPSDTELLEQVVETTVSELGYAVLSRFQNLQVAYSNRAEVLKKKGDLEQAVEKYVDAIHVEELKNISTPVSDQAKRGIDDLLRAMAS